MPINTYYKGNPAMKNWFHHYQLGPEQDVPPSIGWHNPN